MIQSDAYYTYRLLEQVQTLQQRLGEAVGPEAAITQRCQRLSQNMQKIIASADDSTVQSVFEVTLLPSLDALLVDANYQLKLKKFTKNPTSTTRSDARSANAVKSLEPPSVPYYLPNPKPVFDDEKNAKIEQALLLLKDFLKA